MQFTAEVIADEGDLVAAVIESRAFEYAIESAIDSADLDEVVERAVDNIDFTDHVRNVIEYHDFTDVVEDVLSNRRIEDDYEARIDALDALVVTQGERIEALEAVIARLTEALSPQSEAQPEPVVKDTITGLPATFSGLY